MSTATSERSTRRTKAIGALVLAGVVLPAVFAGAGRALPGGSGPGQARPDQPRSVHAAPPLRAQQQPKLDSQLGSVARTAAANGDAAAALAADALGLDTVGTGVRVVVDAADPLAARTAVTAAGGTVEASAGSLLRAVDAPADLTALAQSPAVARVRHPLTPRADAVADEGVATTGAPPGTRAAAPARASRWPSSTSASPATRTRRRRATCRASLTDRRRLRRQPRGRRRATAPRSPPPCTRSRRAPRSTSSASTTSSTCSRRDVREGERHQDRQPRRLAGPTRAAATPRRRPGTPAAIVKDASTTACSGSTRPATTRPATGRGRGRTRARPRHKTWSGRHR